MFPSNPFPAVKGQGSPPFNPISWPLEARWALWRPLAAAGRSGLGSGGESADPQEEEVLLQHHGDAASSRSPWFHELKEAPDAEDVRGRRRGGGLPVSQRRVSPLAAS